MKKKASKQQTTKMNITLAPNRRTEPFTPSEPLSFGKIRTDHMFLANFKDGKWQNERIVPYGNLELPPGTVGLHYGQQCFEGIKAFQHEDKEIFVGRLEQNAKRLQFSAEKLSMPKVPQQMFLNAIHKLIDIDRLWFPQQSGSTFYIRPFQFGSSDQVFLGPSEEYIFCILLSPSGKYFEIAKPVSLLITEKFHRAAPGGTGAAKAGGNYASSMGAQSYAKSKGCDQVLYLDVTNTNLEEVGAMNHFHIKNGELVIPTFTDTILKSITTLSMIELAKHLGITVKLETINLVEFITDVKSGAITECGGFGTAASISAVGSYMIDKTSETLTVGDGKTGPITQRLYEEYTGIQFGTKPDVFGWMKKVEKQN